MKALVYNLSTHEAWEEMLPWIQVSLKTSWPTDRDPVSNKQRAENCNVEMAQQVSLLALQAREPAVKPLAISWKPQACPSLHVHSSSLLGRRQMDPRACWPIHLAERQASGSLSYSVLKGRRVMKKDGWCPPLDAQFECVHSLGWPV